MEIKFDDYIQDESSGELSLYFTENFRSCTTRELCISYASGRDFLHYRPSSITERSFDYRTRQLSGWEDISISQEKIQMLTDFAMSKVTDTQLQNILRTMEARALAASMEEYETEPEL